MSSCTVATLTSDPALRLRVLVDAGSLDRLVRGVHVSDLEHPARYVLPGELLLTNGLWLERVDPLAWVHEALAAGAAAIGYGAGEGGPNAPAALVDACRELQIGLLEVPADLSFSVIGECVLERNRTPDASVRLQLMRVRRLLQELARGEGHGAAVELLRRETRLPVWLVGPGGRVLAGENPPGTGVLRAASRAARRGDLPCALSPHQCAFGITDALSSMAIVVDRPLAKVSDDARLVIEQAGAYLVLEDARRNERELARSELAGELVTLLWDGDHSTRALQSRLEALGLNPGEGVTVIVSSNDARDISYAATGCSASCVGTLHLGMHVLLVQGCDESDVDQILGLIADGGQEPVAGVGVTSTGAAGLRRALAEALSAHQVAERRPPGQRVVRRLQVASHHQLLDFVDPLVLRAFRESVLGAVERWDAQHGTELLRTLTAFFANDGHWRQTAAELHIHHNTLHYRLDRVARLTGRPIESSEYRVDYALALAVPAELSPTQRPPPELHVQA